MSMSPLGPTAGATAPPHESVHVDYVTPPTPTSAPMHTKSAVPIPNVSGVPALTAVRGKHISSPISGSENNATSQDAFAASLAAQIQQQRQELSELKRANEGMRLSLQPEIAKPSGSHPSPAASPLLASGGVGSMVPPLTLSAVGDAGPPSSSQQSPVHAEHTGHSPPHNLTSGSPANVDFNQANRASNQTRGGLGVSSLDIELRTQTHVVRGNSPAASTGEWARVSLALEDGGVLGYSVGGTGAGSTILRKMPTPFPTPQSAAEQAVGFTTHSLPLPTARTQLLAQHNTERFKQRLDGDKALFEQRWGRGGAGTANTHSTNIHTHTSHYSHHTTQRSRSVGAESRTREGALNDWNAGSGAFGGHGSRPLVEHLLYERLRDAQDDAQRSRAALLVAENRLKEMATQRAENQVRMVELENEVRRKVEEDARGKRTEWEQERLRILQRAEAAERETARQKENADHQLKRALREAEMQQREYALQVLQESSSRLTLVEQQERRRWIDEVESGKRLVDQLTDRVRELETELSLVRATAATREEEEKRNSQHAYYLMEELRSQMKEEEQQQDARFERERADRALAFQKERDVHAAEEQRLKALHAADIARLQAAHEGELERERALFRAQLERQREIHAAEQERMLEQYCADRERDRAALEAQWQRERDSHTAALDAVCEEGRELCSRERQRYEELLARERLDHSVEIQQIKGEHHASIEAAKAMYSEEMERERAERTAESQRAAQQREDVFVVETMQIRSVREEAERRLTQLREEFQRERTQWELRVGDMDARLEAAHQEREVALTEARLMSKRVDSMMSDKVEALYNAEACINNLTQSLNKERDTRVELEHRLSVQRVHDAEHLDLAVAPWVSDHASMHSNSGYLYSQGGVDSPSAAHHVMVGRASSSTIPLDRVEHHHSLHLHASRSSDPQAISPIVHVEHVRSVPDSCDTIAADRANRCLQLAREYATKCAQAEDVRTRVSSRVEDIMSFVRSEQIQNQAVINARTSRSNTPQGSMTQVMMTNVLSQFGPGNSSPAASSPGSIRVDTLSPSRLAERVQLFEPPALPEVGGEGPQSPAGPEEIKETTQQQDADQDNASIEEY